MITAEKKSARVGQYVNTEYVNTVLREYKKERWAYNSERLGKEDSLSIWFGVEDIENFIADAKQNGADGIKFYFAAYPKDFEKPEYAGRQTIVMVATRAKTTELGTVNKDVYITKNGNSTILGFNMGAPCPPLCGPGFGTGNLGVTLIDKGDKGLEII
jgi:hypothetical protein